MQLKLKCIKYVIFDGPNVWSSYCPNDTAYATIHDNGDVYLSKTPKGIYCGPYRPSDVGEYFVSDFDEDKYYKHCKHAYNVKIYTDGTLLATADNAIYFE